MCTVDRTQINLMGVELVEGYAKHQIDHIIRRGHLRDIGSDMRYPRRFNAPKTKTYTFTLTKEEKGALIRDPEHISDRSKRKFNKLFKATA